MNAIEIKGLKTRDITLSVPCSKSIFSRALLLAAFTEGETLLTGCGEIGRDGLELVRCLERLGIKIKRKEDAVLVFGTRRFAKKAALDVGSGGTSARFLTAILAFFGGDYRLSASAQMENRPMDLIGPLSEAGVRFEFGNTAGHFPFRMRSDGIRTKELTVDTDVSTQYASGILLSAALGEAPFTLRLTGNRINGSYIKTTLSVLRAFGAKVRENGNEIEVEPIRENTKEYAVAVDLSGACYFYALSLFGAKVCVRGAFYDENQADRRFLDVLKEHGVKIDREKIGLTAEGSGAPFDGFDLDLSLFSDQALTFAALAPFARSQTRLYGIAHIRRQECDRIRAIEENLTRLGVRCLVREDGVVIDPAPVRPSVLLKSYSDHRVAMAFSLIGVGAGSVFIDDPACCEKTFGNYFRILKSITE